MATAQASRRRADESFLIPALYVVECTTIFCGFIAMLVIFMLR